MLHCWLLISAFCLDYAQINRLFAQLMLKFWYYLKISQL